MPIRRSPNGAGHTRPQPGRDRPEWVVAINGNARSQSIGNGGRNQPVRALQDPRTGVGYRFSWRRVVYFATVAVSLYIILYALSRAVPRSAKDTTALHPVSDALGFIECFLPNYGNPLAKRVSRRSHVKLHCDSLSASRNGSQPWRLGGWITPRRGLHRTPVIEPPLIVVPEPHKHAGCVAALLARTCVALADATGDILVRWTGNLAGVRRGLNRTATRASASNDLQEHKGRRSGGGSRTWVGDFSTTASSGRTFEGLGEAKGAAMPTPT